MLLYLNGLSVCGQGVAVALTATSGSHTSDLGVVCVPVQFSHPGECATTHTGTPYIPVCKITQAKTKDNNTKSPGWKDQRYFEQETWIQVHFLYQVIFSFLVLKVCFQLLSVTSKIMPFQLVHIFKLVHMQNYLVTI